MVALNRIGQIALNVRDLRRAVNFYRDVLGMRHLFDAEPKMSFFDCGGVRLMLGVAEQAQFDHPASILYYRVDDIEAAHRELVAKGVRFEQAPHLVARLPDHDLWLGFARDSEDNLFALMSEVTQR
jgi:methylmalonyl-CoA/ethylmalonyl-CoA epimerase